ncbi:hypothetical protein [Luteolibacter pohnpeiensis]|nr:hypothetical protein [Luteolibacter pohnpeiensis]
MLEIQALYLSTLPSCCGSRSKDMIWVRSGDQIVSDIQIAGSPASWQIRINPEMDGIQKGLILSLENKSKFPVSVSYDDASYVVNSGEVVVISNVFEVGKFVSVKIPDKKEAHLRVSLGGSKLQDVVDVRGDVFLPR